MAVLIDANRVAINSTMQKDLSRLRQTIPIGSQALKAAIDAVDAWVNDNSGSYNTALPEPAKSALSAKQKAQLLMYVVAKRWEVA